MLERDWKCLIFVQKQNKTQKQTQTNNKQKQKQQDNHFNLSPKTTTLESVQMTRTVYLF